MFVCTFVDVRMSACVRAKRLELRGILNILVVCVRVCVLFVCVWGCVCLGVGVARVLLLVSVRSLARCMAPVSSCG